MNQLEEQIFEAGIVGAGGAGFPTHVKVSGDIETLIINGVECEPLLQVDKSLMQVYTGELVESITYIMEQKNIKSTIIGIKDKYKDIIEKLQYFTKNDDRITVKPLPNVYPVGDEVVLIKETTGLTLKKGQLPITYKLMVINVETLLNVYKKVFAGENVTKSYVTVIGEVENPGTYYFPIGTELSVVLKDFCPPKVKDYKVIVGGPMTGKLAQYSEVVKKTTKAFIVLPREHSLIRKMDDVDDVHLKRIMASCSQCRMCTDMCPRHLLGHQVEPHKLMNAMANGLTDNVEVLKTALGCVDCGVCELFACHHDLSVRKMMMAVKKAYAKEGIRPSPDDCIDPHPDRDYRKVPSTRLTMHLNLTKYNQHVEYKEEAITVIRVRIPLVQHIGAPSLPCVQIGDFVECNALIAKCPDKKLGANIHSSISGRIVDINETHIVIERV